MDSNLVNKISYPLINVDDLLEVAHRSVCIIRNNEGTGTGFFIKFQFEDEVLCGLMTNNHVLNKNQLCVENNPVFEIHFEDNNEKFSINSQDMNFIFTDELIDITFIQLKDEIINEIKPHYLSTDNKECTENNSIMIIQYSSNEEKFKENRTIQKLSISYGKIKNTKGINYSHDSPTYFASSGSPLFNTLNVVGIHKSSNGEENYATKISVAKYAIVTSYKRKFKNEISNTLGVTEELSNEKIKDFEKHNLIHQKDNIFKYQGNGIISSLLFYRTNYAWYWTDQVINSCDMEILKYLNWTLINPYDDEINEDESLSTIHKTIIMWLRLSEYIYL